MYYNAKTLEKRVLEHAQRCESCEELSLVRMRSRQERSSYLDTGCTSTADVIPITLFLETWHASNIAQAVADGTDGGGGGLRDRRQLQEVHRQLRAPRAQGQAGRRHGRHGGDGKPGGRGLHSSTFRLNVSAFCGIGGVLGGCIGVV